MPGQFSVNHGMYRRPPRERDIESRRELIAIARTNFE
jgi:hypothetical protein